MDEISVTSTNYIPNIRILTNYIITFNEKSIILFDLKGSTLDSINNNINEDIKDILKIDNNKIIAISEYLLLQIVINDNKLEIQNKHFFKDKISDCLYLSKDNILILNIEKYFDFIEIFKINSLELESIQTIFIDFYFNSYPYLYHWNDELFLVCNMKMILIYQKINGTTTFQLVSKYKFKSLLPLCIKKLLKLDNKTLMISIKNKIQLFNIKKFRNNQNLSFLNNNSIIDFIKKIGNNIYLYNDNILFIFRFCGNKIILIQLIKKKILDAFNYFLNLYLEYYYKLTIKINCIENKDIDKDSLNGYLILNSFLSEFKNDFLEEISLYNPFINDDNYFPLDNRTNSYKSLKSNFEKDFINVKAISIKNKIINRIKKIFLLNRRLSIKKMYRKCNRKIRKNINIKNNLPKKNVNYYPKNFKKNYR